MLTLTPTAAEVVRTLVADAPIDEESGGIRISPAAQTPEGTSLQLALVDAPQTTDEEIDAGGAHVFLAEQVAEFPDDKVLDAMIEPGGEVRFAVQEQRGFEPSPDGGPPA